VNIWTQEEEVTGGWRILHNEDLLNLHPPSNSVRMIKSNRMIGMEYAARVGK
jgi:hypothetical protein